MVILTWTKHYKQVKRISPCQSNLIFSSDIILPIFCGLPLLLWGVHVLSTFFMLSQYHKAVFSLLQYLEFNRHPKAYVGKPPCTLKTTLMLHQLLCCCSKYEQRVSCLYRSSHSHWSRDTGARDSHENYLETDFKCQKGFEL